MRRETPLPHLVDVDPVELDQGTGRSQTEERSSVDPGQRPPHGHGVAVDEHIVKNVSRPERGADDGDPLLEADTAGALAGERHMIVIVLGCELIEEIEVAGTDDVPEEPEDGLAVPFARHGGIVGSLVAAGHDEQSPSRSPTSTMQPEDDVRQGSEGIDALAAALKRLRTAAGLTQEELAERAAISARTVSDIERGLRTTVYRDTARRLADALGLSGEARHSFEWLVRPHNLAEAVPALPAFPTPLLGRSSELAAVTAAMASGVRLLTLTGPGGIGKTRLALEAARRLGESFPSGVVFVPLDDVHDPALVAPSVAKALGAAETGEEIGVLIERRLAGRRVLLVLDTFEHLLAAGSLVATLLARCPESAFLVTSRSPLHIRGESELPVPPLEVPVSLRDDSLGDLRRSPGTALFLERAQAVRPELRMDETAAPLVLEICRKLEGLPLAIELAAARVKHLPLAALAAGLDHRLRVLTGGPHDLPTRQRTIRETVGWSHELLPPASRVLFRRLAVFSGGWSLASIETVCGPTDGDPLDALSTLIDHSLVTAAGAGADPRYDMLDVVREYAAERLDEAGEAKTIARQHALHYLHLAEEAEPNLVGSSQEHWLRRLDAERGNLRQAVAWSIARGETETALRFTVALWRYWRHTGELGEGRRWSEATIAMPGDVPDSLLAKAIWGTAFLAYPQGDFVRMAELAAWDVAVARRGGDPLDVRNALTITGQVAMGEGRYADAIEPFREGLEICRSLGLSWQLGTSHLNYGNALLHTGRLAEADEVYQRGRDAYRRLGDETFAAHITVALAHTALARDDVEAAERLAREALVTFVRLAERIGIAEALDTIAGVAARRDEGERAARLDGAATRIQDAIAARPAPHERAITRRLLAAARASLGEAQWERARTEGGALNVEAAVADALG